MLSAVTPATPRASAMTSDWPSTLGARYPTGAAGKDRATRRSIERSTMTVARKNFAFTVHVAPTVRNLDGDPAGQRHIAFLVQQALTSTMNSDKRCGTGCLYADTRTAQVELIRDACSQHVLIISSRPEHE